jgi:hypothetical protein
VCFDCNGTCWPPYYIGEHLHIISRAWEDDEELCKKPNEGNFQRVTACAELFKQIDYSYHAQMSHVKIFIKLLSYVIPTEAGIRHFEKQGALRQSNYLPESRLVEVQ